MKKNKGITLIALVITIIVLLILAGVSIATLLGENGILNQATKAVERTNSATEKEKVQLACNAQMSKNAEKGKYTMDAEDINEIQEELDSLKAGAKITEGSNPIEVVFPNGNTYTISNGKVLEQAKVGEKVTGENKAYTNKGTAIIPEGFTIVPGCDDVSEGLVISDNEVDTELDPSEKVAEGNQFVWVPVENFNEFKREAGYYNEVEQPCEFVTDVMTEGKYYEPNTESTDTTYTSIETLKETKEMYQSVKGNGGFYIGRYEAGTTDTNTSNTGIRGMMVCKKGATVYNKIGWSNAEDMTIETGGAVQVAREFATKQGYTSVKSTLCYGVQWDAVMRWMKNIENPNAPGKKYIQNSKGMGWYKDNSNNEVKKAGIDIGNGENNTSNKVKNIYDMAGNVLEWTMEANNTNRRVSRGGHCYNEDSQYTVSYRDRQSPNWEKETAYGFRPALYL